MGEQKWIAVVSKGISAENDCHTRSEFEWLPYSISITKIFEWDFLWCFIHIIQNGIQLGLFCILKSCITVCVLIDNLLFFFGRPRPLSPKAQLEQEKKIRREIANSNERRRMQSINAGFQSLKTLLPHHAGEKLSKVSWSHAFSFFS